MVTIDTNKKEAAIIDLDFAGLLIITGVYIGCAWPPFVLSLYNDDDTPLNYTGDLSIIFYRDAGKKDRLFQIEEGTGMTVADAVLTVEISELQNKLPAAGTYYFTIFNNRMPFIKGTVTAIV